MAKLVLIILVQIILQLISGIFARPDNYRLSEEQITGLRDIAMQWKNLINLDKNPCEEFPHYVCNNEDYPMPQNPKTRDVEDRLKEILTGKPDLMTKAEEKYLKYSTTCKSLKVEEMREFIKGFKFDNSIGNWPAFEEYWDDRKFNLPLAIAEMNSYHSPVVFTQEVVFDISDGIKTSLQIKQVLFNIENHKEEFKTQFEELGVNDPEEVLTDAVLFQKTYNEIADSQTSSTDLKIVFSELKDFIPEMEWDKQMEKIFGVKPFDSYPVVIKSHEKLKQIYKVISKLSPRVIANYFFCVFVYNTNDLSYMQAPMLFMPVIKQGFLKHICDQNVKDQLKEMYMIILETLENQNFRQDFKIHYNSKQIATFINEDLFALSNDEDLANEFKDISANSNECIRNYYHLRQLHMMRSVKPLFCSKNTLGTIIREQIKQDLVYRISKFIEESSSYIFKHISYSVMINIDENSLNMTAFTNATKECFAKQFTGEVTNDDMKMILAAQLLLKAFAEWTKNYPDVVQEENKVLKEYGLSAEKLLVLSIVREACRKTEVFNAMMIAFGNSIEFQQIYDCPVGSQMNTAKKCIFGSFELH